MQVRKCNLVFLSVRVCSYRSKGHAATISKFMNASGCRRQHTSLQMCMCLFSCGSARTCLPLSVHARELAKVSANASVFHVCLHNVHLYTYIASFCVVMVFGLCGCRFANARARYVCSCCVCMCMMALRRARKYNKPFPRRDKV